MPARDETILFSAIAILLGTLTIAGLADFASPTAQAITSKHELQISRPAANARESQVVRDGACSSTAAAPAERSGAEQRG